MRRYDEPVQVRLSDGPDGTHGGGGPVPDAFLWRNRLYVVREVLASWLEREAWWEQTSGRAVPERTVWRVEAGAGRMLGTGVYDLAHAAPAAVPAGVAAGAPVGVAAGVPVGVPALAGGPGPSHGPSQQSSPGSSPGSQASQHGDWWLLCHLD